MHKANYHILFILLLLAFAALACVGGVDNGPTGAMLGVRNNSSQMNISVMATATFGAEQFQAQLTAIAEQKSP